MKTTSIDLAAYLYLKGFRPHDVTFAAQNRREFTFLRADGLGDAIRAFDAGVFVPLNTFLEARVTMKDWRVDTGARAGHYSQLAKVRRELQMRTA